MSMLKTAISAAFMGLMSVSVASASTITIGTDQGTVVDGQDNQGWWNDTNANKGSKNDNYLTGFYKGQEFRSYFTFDLSGVTDDITAVTLDLRRYYRSDNITLNFYDVSTSAAALAQRGVVDANIFADLGSGASYGSHTLAMTSNTRNNGKVLSFALNSDAVAAVNAARGGYFSIGVAASQGGGNIFRSSRHEQGNGGPGFTQNLVLETQPAQSRTLSIAPPVPTVPLPAGGLLLLTAAGALVVARKKTNG